MYNLLKYINLYYIKNDKKNNYHIIKSIDYIQLIKN